MHPGVVRTEIVREYAAKPLVKLTILLLYPLILTVLKNCREGAQTTLHCALADGIESMSGEYFSDCAYKKTAPIGEDKEAAERLWKLSCQMVGLKE